PACGIGADGASPGQTFLDAGVRLHGLVCAATPEGEVRPPVWETTRMVRVRSLRSTGSAAIAVLLGVSCAHAAPAPPAPVSSPGVSLAAGEWGGEHLRLTVNAQGAALEFDCAHGSTAKAIALDADKRFDAAGRFVREHGGPVRRDEAADPGAPARYVGSLKDDTLTLEIV